MDCPRCTLVNPDTALRCDCGYDFATGTVKDPYCKQELLGRRSLSNHLAARLGISLLLSLLLLPAAWMILLLPWLTLFLLPAAVWLLFWVGTKEPHPLRMLIYPIVALSVPMLYVVSQRLQFEGKRGLDYFGVWVIICLLETWILRLFGLFLISTLIGHLWQRRRSPHHPFRSGD